MSQIGTKSTEGLNYDQVLVDIADVLDYRLVNRFMVKLAV